MTYVLTSTAAFALTILCIGRQRGLGNSAIATLIGGGLAISLFLTVCTQPHPWPIYPLVLLFGASFLAICLYPREIVPIVHEGEVAVMSLTCAYLLGEASPGIRLLIFGLTLPLTAYLIRELLSNRLLARASRVAMGVFFSLMCAALCAYQVYHSQSIFYSEVVNWSVTVLFAKSFVIQFSIFWAGLHTIRLVTLLPADSRKGFDKKLVGEMADSVSPVNVPVKSVLLACSIHGLPLILNSYFRLLPAPLMVSYAALVSPFLVELVLAGRFKPAAAASKPENLAA
jgi:hypothetical protein